MDVLKDKSKKSYPYISRYSPFSYYYHSKDDKYIYGITSYLIEDAPYVLHSVKETDTFFSLSEYYYGRPDLYWIIADYNRIVDATIEISKRKKTLRIPSISDITFKQE